MRDSSIDIDELVAESEISYPLRYRHFLQTGVTGRIPESISLETTSACQLECPMCDRAGMRRPALAMSDEVFKTIIDKVAPHRVRVSFSGVGEPLLDRKLAARIAYARSQGVPEAALVTNGMLLNERRSRELIAAGLTRITISLDGDDQLTHETGHKGADYATVAANVETLLRVKEEVGADHLLVVLRVTLQRGNLDAATSIYRTWRKRATVQFNLAYQYGEGRIDGLLPPAWDERIACPQMLATMLVLTNGEATICCMGDINAELGVGNLTVDSLEACWDGPRAREIRGLHRTGDLSTLPVCQKCAGCTAGNLRAGAFAQALEARCRTLVEAE